METTNFDVHQPHHDVQQDDGLQRVESSNYVEEEDDGLVGIQNINFYPKQEFDDDDDDWVYMHDVDVLEIVEEWVHGNKKKVINLGHFNHVDEMDKFLSRN